MAMGIFHCSLPHGSYPNWRTNEWMREFVSFYYCCSIADDVNKHNCYKELLNDDCTTVDEFNWIERPPHGKESSMCVCLFSRFRFIIILRTEWMICLSAHNWNFFNSRSATFHHDVRSMANVNIKQLNQDDRFWNAILFSLFLSLDLFYSTFSDEFCCCCVIKTNQMWRRTKEKN